MLPGIDINFNTTTVYKSREDKKFDSKAVCADHIVSYQHLCFQSVNWAQLAVEKNLDLIALFDNSRDIDCCKDKDS